MTKQEEIMEGIARNLPQSKLCFRCEETICDGNDKNICKVQFAIADNILAEEVSQGVVIKVDGELPSVFDSNGDVISALEYKKKLAGFVATMPLINETEDK